MTAPSQLVVEAADFIKSDPQAALQLLADVDPISWMGHIDLKTEKGDPIEFRDHMPLVQVYRDMHPEQVYRKGAQIGATETCINKVLWLGDHNNITVIYTMPTADAVYKFSQGRFNPVIRGNFYLRKRMKNTDNSTQKQIGNSWIYFKGAQKESQAISIPADGLVIDEYDFSPPDILDAFGKRLVASKNPFKWYFSTPTLPGYGIDALFENTDQMHWLVPCSYCPEGKRWQTVDFWRNIKKRKGKWYFACRRCGRQLYRRKGLWVPKYPSRATDAVYDAQGRLLEPASGARGYFINPLAFTFITATRKMQEFLKAEKSSQASAIKNFHNFDLGIPYVSGMSLITEETIRSTMRADYDTTGFNVFGCDQGDVLHWVVKHVTPDGHKPVVAFGKTTEFSEAWEKFQEWNCRVGVIDALPNKKNARDLVTHSGKRLFMAYYKDQNEVTKEKVEDERKEGKTYQHSRRETQTLNIDRTESLDNSATDWIQGRAFLARPKEYISEEAWEFIHQMQGMKRDLQDDSKGITKAVWVKVAPDHYRHADNYATIAAELKTIGSSSQIAVGGAITTLVPEGGIMNDLGVFDIGFLFPNSRI